MLLRAVEERVFLPMGSDREVKSEFQLIAGTNRDLIAAVERGAFRDDLLARINVWTFRLPGLAERPEDIEPNLDFEVERAARELGARITWSREARERFLRFARSAEALWTGNFRDFSAAVTRLSTLAKGGRIGVDDVEGELALLRSMWRSGDARAPVDIVAEVLGPARSAELDPFDRVQLAEVLRVCRSSRSLSDAGRTLFAASRSRRRSVNDADRLRKYLAKFELDWADIAQ